MLYCTDGFELNSQVRAAVVTCVLIRIANTSISVRCLRICNDCGQMCKRSALLHNFRIRKLTNRPSLTNAHTPTVFGLTKTSSIQLFTATGHFRGRISSVSLFRNLSGALLSQLICTHLQLVRSALNENDGNSVG